MKMLKNRLIIVILSNLFYISSSYGMQAVQDLPTHGFLDSASNNMQFIIHNQPVRLELAYIYIPNDFKEQAIDKTEELVKNNKFNFIYTHKTPNRHGNYEAIITPHQSTISLQEALIANGLALVYFIDSSSHEKQLFASEEKARMAKIALWAKNGIKILNTKNLASNYKQNLSKFVIIQGVASNTYISKKHSYVNFGDDWKTDFSIQIDNKILKKSPDFNIDNLAGKTIRARGWLENYNGPFLKISNLANIEVITGE